MRNFLSYGNVPTLVELDELGTTLILGENLDDTTSGTRSNGVGKTVIVNAICYAAYDKTISPVTKDALVNNINKKNMEVTIEFTKGADTYFIKRVRKSKTGAAGNYVQLFENGKDVTPDSVGNTNREIEKIIGIPYELFVRIVTFSAIHTPFLDLPVRSHYAANQTDIIESLFSLTQLSDQATLLKTKRDDTVTRLQVLMERDEQLEREHNRHSIQVESAKKRVIEWNRNNKTEIENIVRKLKRLSEVDIEEQKRLNTILADIDNDLKAAINEQQHTDASIKQFESKYRKADKKLRHLRDDKCPYCLQLFADTDEKINRNEQVVNDMTAQLETTEQKLVTWEHEVAAHTSKHKEIKAKIVADLEELTELQGKGALYQQRQKDLENAANPYVEPLQELQAVKLESLNKDKINDLMQLIDHQKFLLKLLTKKDSFVRKTLLHKNLPFLNERLAYYLTKLGLPHNVEFTHEMTAKITQFGRPIDFGALSNGQRASVNIALSFAFRDVLQNLHDYINVCVLDEVLDVGLDAVGVQNAARMLKRKARDEGISLFIISHRPEMDGSAFDNTMTVQMSKGFSYIKKEE